MTILYEILKEYYSDNQRRLDREIWLSDATLYQLKGQQIAFIRIADVLLDEGEITKFGKFLEEIRK